MTDQNNKTINILSLLNGDLAGGFGNLISADSTFTLTEDECIFDTDDLRSPVFWDHVGNKKQDAIIVPLSSRELEELKDNIDVDETNMFDSHRPWQYVNAAVIVALSGDNIHDAVFAAQMDFDGIVAEPFVDGHLQTIIKDAIDRKNQKNKLNARYNRLQRVLKVINQNRHILQSKVDLLCNDLVQSNRDMAGRMKEISKAYDFQKNLTGEFDLKYMLQKALQQITGKKKHTNAAVYLCETDKIEVMLMDSWFDGELTPQQLESCLKNSIIPVTIEAGDSLIINNAGEFKCFPEKCCSNLKGLSMCSVPLSHNDHIEGILILYRSDSMPFESTILDELTPIIAPLSRSIEGLLKLQEMLS